MSNRFNFMQKSLKYVFLFLLVCIFLINFCLANRPNLIVESDNLIMMGRDVSNNISGVYVYYSGSYFNDDGVGIVPDLDRWVILAESLNPVFAEQYSWVSSSLNSPIGIYVPAPGANVSGNFEVLEEPDLSVSLSGSACYAGLNFNESNVFLADGRRYPNFTFLGVHNLYGDYSSVIRNSGGDDLYRIVVYTNSSPILSSSYSYSFNQKSAGYYDNFKDRINSGGVFSPEPASGLHSQISIIVPFFNNISKIEILYNNTLIYSENFRSRTVGYDLDMDGYYEIRTCRELQDMINSDSGANYELVNDIDCSETRNWNGGSGFRPIDVLRGNFEGNNHTIYNLSMAGGIRSSLSLFGAVYGDISNVALSNVAFSGMSSVYGLVSYSTGDIYNSHVQGSLSGARGMVAGLAGGARDIYNSHSDVYIHMADSGDAIGLAGSVRGIYNSYSTGRITAREVVGAYGLAASAAIINNSYSDINISGSMCYAAGLIGKAYNPYLWGNNPMEAHKVPIVYNSYFNGFISSSSNHCNQYDHSGNLIASRTIGALSSGYYVPGLRYGAELSSAFLSDSVFWSYFSYSWSSPEFIWSSGEFLNDGSGVDFSCSELYSPTNCSGKYEGVCTFDSYPSDAELSDCMLYYAKLHWYENDVNYSTNTNVWKAHSEGGMCITRGLPSKGYGDFFCSIRQFRDISQRIGDVSNTDSSVFINAGWDVSIWNFTTGRTPKLKIGFLSGTDFFSEGLSIYNSSINRDILCRKTCLSEGEAGDSTNECCSGLLKSWISIDKITCVDCGNGVCDSHEDFSICSTDCNNVDLNCLDGKIFNGYQCVIEDVCGNRIKENNEDCDDGNMVNLDGCSSTCKLELSCADSDYLNSSVMGHYEYLNSKTGVVRTGNDYCKNSNELIEWYCGVDWWRFWDRDRRPMFFEVYCDNGCSEGRCL